MTTEAQAVEAITLAFLTGWATLHPTDCPVALDGESFTAVAQWVQVSIVPDRRAQRSMGPSGSRRVGDTGSIAVKVHVDVNQGVLARAQLCDDVRAVLELQNLTIAGNNEPIRIFAGGSRNPSTDGRWLTQIVVAEYDYMGTV